MRIDYPINYIDSNDHFADCSRRVSLCGCIHTRKMISRRKTGVWYYDMNMKMVAIVEPLVVLASARRRLIRNSNLVISPMMK